MYLSQSGSSSSRYTALTEPFSPETWVENVLNQLRAGLQHGCSRHRPCLSTYSCVMDLRCASRGRDTVNEKNGTGGVGCFSMVSFTKGPRSLDGDLISIYSNNPGDPGEWWFLKSTSYTDDRSYCSSHAQSGDFPKAEVGAAFATLPRRKDLVWWNHFGFPGWGYILLMVMTFRMAFFSFTLALNVLSFELKSGPKSVQLHVTPALTIHEWVRSSS